MSNHKPLIVKETLQSLKQTLKDQPGHLQVRIEMLILIKESKAQTKLLLAEALGVNPNSILAWRKKYVQRGLSGLLEYNRGGQKPSLITDHVHKAIEKRLMSETDGFKSYVELRAWVAEHFVPGIKYTTLNEYVKRKFGDKLKTTRKNRITPVQRLQHAKFKLYSNDFPGL